MKQEGAAKKQKKKYNLLVSAKAYVQSCSAKDASHQSATMTIHLSLRTTLRLFLQPARGLSLVLRVRGGRELLLGRRLRHAEHKLTRIESYWLLWRH